ncbi:hypothetical protein FF38_00084 [Lucilia cuprina]|uniref:Uncharacterized protein n=1 Tax=Lucilia cuprina TaxID=7375 RepID=A0A0L0BL40_LUCCU|nr:hypothetical protein FF38_00084 [Lucilia cuprina]
MFRNNWKNFRRNFGQFLLRLTDVISASFDKYTSKFLILSSCKLCDMIISKYDQKRQIALNNTQNTKPLYEIGSQNCVMRKDPNSCILLWATSFRLELGLRIMTLDVISASFDKYTSKFLILSSCKLCDMIISKYDQKRQIALNNTQNTKPLYEIGSQNCVMRKDPNSCILLWATSFRLELGLRIMTLVMKTNITFK